MVTSSMVLNVVQMKMLHLTCLVLTLCIVGSTEAVGKECYTESCQLAAEYIKMSMDSSVNPCNDFYSYACNGWIKGNPLPEGRNRWTTFDMLKNKNLYLMKGLLEQPSRYLESIAEKKTQLYYKSCIDKNHDVDKMGADPLRDLLWEIGGWNVTESGFDVTKWNFQKIIHILKIKYNTDCLFSWSMEKNYKNPNGYIILIDQIDFIYPNITHYLDGLTYIKLFIDYLDSMTRVGIILGSDVPSAESQMKDVIEFEMKLAKISMTEEKRAAEPEYTMINVYELQKLAPFMDWTIFFERVMSMVDRKLKVMDNVVVFAPDYLIKLTKLLKEYQTTNEKKIILNNYMVWQLVRNVTSYLYRPFRLTSNYSGSPTIFNDRKTWQQCVKDTKEKIGFALDTMVDKQVFHETSILHAKSMLYNVTSAFKKSIKTLKWMDRPTAEKALTKASAMSKIIGYPDFVLYSAVLDRMYENLEVHVNQYFKNNVKIRQFKMLRSIQKLFERSEIVRWEKHHQKISAYYVRTKNQIVLPAGMLQPPFYSRSYPPSINFGGTGSMVGHEMTHAFISYGTLYDKDGNFHQWWSYSTLWQFMLNSKCVQEQYSNYIINNKKMDGKNTLLENIADHAGVKVAYDAFLQLEKQYGPFAPLPELRSLSHRKLFFLSFAQKLCETAKTNFYKKNMDHSPVKYRVIGTLSNMKEFSDEFKCPVGSLMNPAKKCTVW